MKLGQGRDNTKQLLVENKALADEIEAKITAYYENLGKKTEEPEDEVPGIMPVQADTPAEEPKRRRKVNIDIAVD
jgi:hypothetical protein